MDFEVVGYGAVIYANIWGLFLVLKAKAVFLVSNLTNYGYQSHLIF